MLDYNGARLWVADIADVEEGALQQIDDMLADPFTLGVAAMPDIHVGYGVPIGGVWVVNGRISPEAVGYDIGCGVFLAQLPMKKEEFLADRNSRISLDAKIRRFIPTGHNRRKDRHHGDILDKHIKLHGDAAKAVLEFMKFEHMTSAPIRQQLGTLGGGNHFIEFVADEHNDMFLLIHSGSRKFGWDIADKYMKIAKELSPTAKIPSLDLCSTRGEQYVEHQERVLRFAKANRAIMGSIIIEKVTEVYSKQWDIMNDVQAVDVHHNFAEILPNDTVVHRKGATSAKLGEDIIIPGSMAEHSFFGKGLGNPLSFHSCSHGAGRKMGRNRAKRELDFEVFKEQMEDANVYSTSIIPKNLDEAPDAYKNSDVIVALQSDLIRVTHTFSPLLNIKGE